MTITVKYETDSLYDLENFGIDTCSMIIENLENVGNDANDIMDYFANIQEDWYDWEIDAALDFDRDEIAQYFGFKDEDDLNFRASYLNRCETLEDIIENYCQYGLPYSFIGSNAFFDLYDKLEGYLVNDIINDEMDGIDEIVKAYAESGDCE